MTPSETARETGSGTPHGAHSVLAYRQHCNTEPDDGYWEITGTRKAARKQRHVVYAGSYYSELAVGGQRGRLRRQPCNVQHVQVQSRAAMDYKANAAAHGKALQVHMG